MSELGVNPAHELTLSETMLGPPTVKKLSSASVEVVDCLKLLVDGMIDFPTRTADRRVTSAGIEDRWMNTWMTTRSTEIVSRTTVLSCGALVRRYETHID